LTPAVKEVLTIIAEHPDVVLATGHLSAKEIDVLIQGAFDLQAKRLLITHPLYMVDAELTELKSWIKSGAYLEFTAINSLPDSKLYTLPPSKIAETIEAVGPDKIILSSDSGLKDNGRPFGNMVKLLELLYREGIDTDDLKRLVVNNPARLLNLKK
jgi:predicted TIM-barrel fold metal-dependent hydrolase